MSPFASRALLVVGGLTVGLAIAEIVARAFTPDPPQQKFSLNHDDEKAFYHCYDTNPHGELGPLPDMDLEGWKLHDYQLPPKRLPMERRTDRPHCVEYKFNGHGFRDRDWGGTSSAAGSRTRIAMVGDSFVFGEGVPAKLTLPRKLDDELGDDYEVINAGLPGIDTASEVDIMYRLRAELGVQRAVVVYVLNDVPLVDDLRRAENEINDLINLRRDTEGLATETFKLPGLVLSAFRKHAIEMQTISWYQTIYDIRENGPSLKQLQSDLQKIAKIPGLEVTFVIYPLIYMLEEEYPFAGQHARMKRMAEKLGIPVLDLRSTFQGQETSNMYVHPTDRHPSGRAHALAARAIARWLKDEHPGFLRPLEPPAAR